MHEASGGWQLIIFLNAGRERVTTVYQHFFFQNVASTHLNDPGIELGPYIQGVVLHHVEGHRTHHQHMLLIV